MLQLPGGVLRGKLHQSEESFEARGAVPIPHQEIAFDLQQFYLLGSSTDSLSCVVPQDGLDIFGRFHCSRTCAKPNTRASVREEVVTCQQGRRNSWRLL